MTHSDFHRVNNAIARACSTGVFPNGIMTASSFNEFHRLVKSYLQHRDDTTVDRDAVQALKRYNVPLVVEGIGWRLHYVK